MISRDSSPVLFDYPNPGSNVFLMMRFRDTKQHREILTAVRDALTFYGLHGLRADDKMYSDALWPNVKFYMDACDLGIAIFEQIEDDDFNPNVSLELGYMMAAKKPVLLLKERHLKSLPADVVGHLYKAFDSYDISSTIRPRILDWLRDIGIAKSLSDADLILVMEASLRDGLPVEKTFDFNPFLGHHGDVANPWPDDEDEAARRRYTECMRAIRTAVEDGTDKILAYLEKQPTTR